MVYHTDVLSKYCMLSLLQSKWYTPLLRAASEGHTDCVKELLSSGATVDLADEVSI